MNNATCPDSSVDLGQIAPRLVRIVPILLTGERAHHLGGAGKNVLSAQKTDVWAPFSAVFASWALSAL
jgi:hypothetical protein